MSVEKLEHWESQAFGMFVHFGISTFLGEECPDGSADPSMYAPTNLSTDDWARAAADAGMKYIVLTAKHVAGHCLWPSKLTDYHSDKDVVAALAESCAKFGLGMGLYYCSWDNHHKFGSVTPSAEVSIFDGRASDEYIDFQLGQLEELLTGYGPIFEMWIDIPQVLGAQGRQKCYDHIAALQPSTVVIMNQGFRGNSELDIDHAWPTDVSTREKQFPECSRYRQGEHGATIGHNRVYEIQGHHYFVPTEICDTLSYTWFYEERDHPRSVEELRAMRTLARERSCNLLLNVPPNRDGLIPDSMRRRLIEAFG